ncbi:MAG TPA: S9 family peptidase [Opitutaceae bacterium]|nr:S9 family peptidase [Opitutaceae bacterium]
MITTYRWAPAFIAMAATLPAAEMIPVEDFARAPAFSHMQLSPDGQHLAFLREYEGSQTLFFAEIGASKKQIVRVDPGYVKDANGARREINSFRWINDRRLIYSASCRDEYYFTGVWAVDCDGSHWQPLSGYDANPTGGGLMAGETIYSFENEAQEILMLDRHERVGTDAVYPEVVKVNTLSGGYKTVMENPGNVVGWGVDHTGCVRLGFTLTDNLKEGVIYRENENSPWQTLAKPAGAHGEVMPLGFDYSNQRFYVAALSAKRRWAVYSFDPATGQLGDVLMEDPEYDIVSETLVPVFDGVALDRSVFSKKKQTLVGIYYLTNGPHTRWFDPDFASYQSQIDAALPHTVNLITSFTRDETRLLVLAFSDQDPGTYYLFDAASGRLSRVTPRMAWIKPELMARTYPVKYQARDGLLIHGYFILPPGRPHENLPLIVMPHGGPWVRDVWGFDPLVQFLASRGYAVLQVNYRGSPGYGEDFYKKARHEIGRGIQDDIEDGVRWAIAKKLADPQRIAIVGASYGGYSALFALGHNPDLYRCGISIAGVTDWPALIKGRDDPETKFAYEYWVQQIGDPKNDEEFLNSISPMNFADKIAAPVLFIHGDDDEIVPPRQAKAMIRALEKTGRKPESLFLSHEGHGLNREEDRIEAYKAIEAFLLKNLGPGAPPEEPAGAGPPAPAPAAGKPAG